MLEQVQGVLFAGADPEAVEALELLRWAEEAFVDVTPPSATFPTWLVGIRTVPYGQEVDGLTLRSALREARRKWDVTGVSSCAEVRDPVDAADD